jgi:hypothetical protein
METVTAFVEKSESEKSKRAGNNKTNNAKASNDKKGNGGRKKSTFVEPSVWAKMTPEQRIEHIKKRGHKKENSNQTEKKEKADGPTKETQANLPSQYTVKNVQVASTADEETTAEAPTVKTGNTTTQMSTQQRIQKMMAEHGFKYTTGQSSTQYKACAIKVTVSDTLKNFVGQQRTGTVGAICADNGTNISIMGSTFRVTEKTSRFVNMVGFADDLEKNNVPICSGVSTYTQDGKKYLLGLHESPHLPENAHSLLSVHQAREHGHGG